MTDGKTKMTDIVIIGAAPVARGITRFNRSLRKGNYCLVTLTQLAQGAVLKGRPAAKQQRSAKMTHETISSQVVVR